MVKRDGRGTSVLGGFWAFLLLDLVLISSTKSLGGRPAFFAASGFPLSEGVLGTFVWEKLVLFQAACFTRLAYSSSNDGEGWIVVIAVPRRLQRRRR
jgi:hypothetical protein